VSLALLLAAPRAEGRKLFLREVRVAPSCVAVSREALLALIAQQIPRDVLALRGLEYEDLSSYEDLANWSPERFEVRQPENIRLRLQQLDVQYMVWLELSCLPAEGRSRYLLTSRMTDLDAMDTILACPAAQAGTRDGRRVCHVGGEVFDAVSYSTLELQGFDDFVPSVRVLLARLLHIPEVSIGTPVRTFDPSEEIDVPFLVRRNDGSEAGYSGPAAVPRTYRMQQDLVQVPPDLHAEVCRAPDERWDQLACAGGFSQGPCDAADRVAFEARTLIHREVPAVAVAALPQGRTGGDRIVARAPSFEAYFVLRAQAIAVEGAAAVRSSPVYACLRVRARPQHWGFVGRLGVPFSGIPGDPHDPTRPATAVPAPAVGIDLYLAQHLFSSRSAALPQHALGLVLGLTTLWGKYPCPDQNRECTGTPLTPLRPHHVSTSWTGEVRAQFRSELFRRWRFAPMVLSVVGLGVEYLTSEAMPFRNDGWGAVFVGGVGLGFAFNAANPTGGSATSWFGVQWQVRRRLEPRAVSVALEGGASWIDSPGVPDLTQVLWFSLGAALAPARATP
jgi:hypothetical protein